MPHSNCKPNRRFAASLAFTRHTSYIFIVNNMGKDKHHEEVANIPPQLSDLHCFTETDGVITTSAYLSPASASV